MGGSSAISPHRVDPPRVAEAEHRALDARPQPVKKGRLAPTDPPGPVPLEKSQTGKLSTHKAPVSADSALKALRAFQTANEINPANVGGLKKTAVEATKAYLDLALAAEQAAKKHAKDDQYGLRPDEVSKLSETVFRAFRWWRQAQETELGLLLTREDDVLNAIVGRVRVSPETTRLVER